MKKSGEIRKIDYEYKRNGTANIFCTVEPKAGYHITEVKVKKRSGEFAEHIALVKSKYPNVKTIHLVMDYYSTHSQKALLDYFGDEEGKRIWQCFTVHYTPKHASWLNQAEIEINMCSSQCLGRKRFKNIEILKKEVGAWNKIANDKKLSINWKFTAKEARKKFKYKNINLYGQSTSNVFCIISPLKKII